MIALCLIWPPPEQRDRRPNDLDRLRDLVRADANLLDEPSWNTPMNKSPGHAPLHGPESVDIAPAPQGNDGFHTNDPNPPGLGSPAPRMREVELNEKGESSQRHGETDADREQRENQQHDDRAAEKVQNDNEKLGSDPDRQQAG